MDRYHAHVVGCRGFIGWTPSNYLRMRRDSGWWEANRVFSSSESNGEGLLKPRMGP